MLASYLRSSLAPLRVVLWTRNVSGAVFRKPHASNYLNLLTVIGATLNRGESVLGRFAVTSRG
jgi:hypothetical protein